MICMCAFFVACAMSFVMFLCWQACNLSSFSLLLHCLHVSLPKGALTASQNSSPNTLHQGTAFTRAPKVNHFFVKLLKYLTWCAHWSQKSNYSHHGKA